MTTPKVATIKRGGSRFYVNPDTGEKVPGVTSVLNMLPKEFLKFWAAKVVAEVAVDQAGSWIGLALNGDPQGAIDYLKRAPMRDTGGAAARGTEAHDIFEKMSLGEKVGRIHPDMEPYRDHFQEFLDTFQPEFLAMEGTVWSDTHGFAGSFDWIARIGDDVVIGDNKTTRSGVHAEVCIQLNTYAAADYILDPDGTQTPLPDITAAAVFHVRPEGWNLVPVVYDPELILPFFLALKKVMEWDKEVSKTVIGKPIPKERSEA